MGRFSPTVLPTAANPFTAALSSAFDEVQAARERKRQQKLSDAAATTAQQGADDRHTAALANLYAMGYRQPSDVAAAPSDLTPTPDFSLPSSSLLGRQLRAGPSIPTGAPTIDQTTPSGDELAAALRGNLSPATQSATSLALRTSPTAPAPAAPAMATTQQAAPRPGLWGAAFDPSTGTFGGTAPPPAGLMIAKAVQQRLNNGMVLDPTQTPQAIAARQQEQTAIGQENRRIAAQHTTEVDQQARDYRTLSAIEPDHAAVKDRPFDPTGHLNYSVLLADALKRREARELAKDKATERGPATLHATTVNPLTKKVEDVYSDGTRKVIRDATPEEVRKATYIADHDKYGTFVDPKDSTKPPVFIHEDAAAALGLVPFQKPGAAAGPKPVAAPIAARVGQFGEMIKKAADLLPMLDSMDVGLGNSAARDIAEHGLGLGHMRIPGTKGLGNLLMNQTPTYAQYQAALSPFVLAAAHSVGGLKVSADQIEAIRKSIEMSSGDFENPTVREQKIQNMIDQINSIGTSLPADELAKQEAQLKPEQMDRLLKRGYLRIGKPTVAPGPRAEPATPTAPTSPAGPSGNIDLSVDPEAAWSAANPALPGEPFEAYHARYLKSQSATAGRGSLPRSPTGVPR